MSIIGEKIQIALSPQVLGFLPTEALTELRAILKNGMQTIDAIVKRRHEDVEKAKKEVDNG